MLLLEIVVVTGWAGVAPAPQADAAFARHVLARDAPAPRGWDALETAGDGWFRGPAGVARARVERETDGFALARLVGADALFVDGDGFAGAPVGRAGFEGFAVALRAGVNELFVVGAGERFRLELEPVDEGIVVGELTAESGRLAWEGRSTFLTPAFLVHNASLRSVEDLHVHYEDVLAFGAEPSGTFLSEWRCGGGIPPLAPALRDVTGKVRAWPAERARAWIALHVYDGACDVPREEQTRTVQPREFVVDDGQDPPVVPHPADAHGPFERRLERFCLVHGTRGTPRESRELLARARYDMETSWVRSGYLPRAISDERLLHELELGGRVPRGDFVLYGNADTNAAWSALLGDDGTIDVRRGVARVDGRVIERDDALVCFVRAVALGESERLVAAFADTGPRGAREGYRLDPFARPGALPTVRVVVPGE